MRLATDRPHVLRQVIQACRKAGTVSVPGLYGGFLDKVPLGAAFAKGFNPQDGADARAPVHFPPFRDPSVFYARGSPTASATSWSFRTTAAATAASGGALTSSSAASCRLGCARDAGALSGLSPACPARDSLRSGGSPYQEWMLRGSGLRSRSGAHSRARIGQFRGRHRSTVFHPGK
jgi:hypothetical protein